MEKNQVTTVIVTYNSKEVIGACLRSINRGAIIVVDNASRDGTAQFIKTEFPHVEVIELDKNIGFGPANNVALEKITTPFAFVLNPDSVLEETTIDNLVAKAVFYENAAIIAPLIFFADGKLQSSFKRSIFFREQHHTNTFQPEGDISAEFLSGAAMLLKMSKFQDFFDPNIFMYYEDDDLCLRTRKSAHDLILTPNATMMHMQGKSSTPSLWLEYFKNKQMAKSRLYLERKYKGQLAFLNLFLRQSSISICKFAFYFLTLQKKKYYKYFGRVVGSFALKAF